MKNNLMKKVVMTSLVIGGAVGLTACSSDSVAFPDGYTYNTYTMVSPSNWNELTYSDNNDTQIMNYLGSDFFGYDFKYDSEGEIIPGDYEVTYEAATKLEDVTEKYAAEWNLKDSTGTNLQKNYAYKITLREDLKWSDGTAIKAADFIYSMQEQLNPLFQNYRADSYYASSTIIRNAENYLKQGQTLVKANATGTSLASSTYTMADLVLGSDGVYQTPTGAKVSILVDASLPYLYDNKMTNYTSYFGDKFADLKAAAVDGYAPATPANITLLEQCITYSADWGETTAYVPCYLGYDYTYDDMEFSEVGYFADGDYGIVLILDKALTLLNSDNTLSYQAAYNMASLPLVKKDLYEANKVAPSGANASWTSKYHSNLATTASWGPYELTTFQAGKQYVLTKNENWFGYGVNANEGLYQTERIVCETVQDWNTAWMLFQAGKVDSIGLNVTIADEYRGSERAYFTPGDFIMPINVQSNEEEIRKYSAENSGINTTILLQPEFREALSLSIDRDDYAKKNTTSYKAGFGLFNSMHYIDVANGMTYRSTDAAKATLANTYGVDLSSYTDEDGVVDYAAAENSITGYNQTRAKELILSAYDKALADTGEGKMVEGDKIVLRNVVSTISDSATREAQYLEDTLNEVVKGTALEGKFEVELANKDSAWASSFRGGFGEICTGNFTGGAWDPGYFLTAYTGSSRYAQGWDPSSKQVTFTTPAGDYDGAGETLTMSITAWVNCINNYSGADYDWSSTVLDQTTRAYFIAAIEQAILQEYYVIPIINQFSASIMSYKVDYVTYEYNTFLGYGGIKYMTYNYNNGDWAKVANKVDYRD